MKWQGIGTDGVERIAGGIAFAVGSDEPTDSVFTPEDYWQGGIVFVERYFLKCNCFFHDRMGGMMPHQIKMDSLYAAGVCDDETTNSAIGSDSVLVDLMWSQIGIVIMLHGDNDIIVCSIMSCFVLRRRELLGCIASVIFCGLLPGGISQHFVVLTKCLVVRRVIATVC